MGKHYETGEALPDHLFEKLVASKNFGSGTRYLRQCHFALTAGAYSRPILTSTCAVSVTRKHPTNPKQPSPPP